MPGTYISWGQCVARYKSLEDFYENDAYADSDAIYYVERDVVGRLSGAYGANVGTFAGARSLMVDECYAMYLMTQDIELYEKFRKQLDARYKALIDGDMYLATDSGTTVAPSQPGQTVWCSNSGYNNTFSMLDADSPFSMVDSARAYNDRVDRGSFE